MIERIIRRFAELNAAPAVVHFMPTSVPANSTITVTQYPRGMFVGEMLINTGDIEGLRIFGMWSGNRPQLKWQERIDAKEFEAGKSKLFDLCSPFEPIVFEVENVTDKPLVWAMSLKGRQLPFWMALFR